jgi:hypothetical protein
MIFMENEKVVKIDLPAETAFGGSRLWNSRRLLPPTEKSDPG